jgi:chromate transporter
MRVAVFGGGLLAGLCFVLPAFGIMLVLVIYAHLGATPIMRGGLYGLGPVVVGIFVVAVYRLSRSEVSTFPQIIIALAAAAAVAFSPVGVVPTLALAAGAGILIFHSLRAGALILAVMSTLLIGASFGPWVPMSLVAPAARATASGHPAGLTEIGMFFSKIGALTFGGGLTIIALIQEQAVDQYHWLTHQEFIDGLALGQFTPGPMIIVAAYVGYKIAGLGGAVLAAAAIFLPSFVITLPILPIFERVRKLVWTTAAMKGIGPAVIGILVVKLGQMAPHAVPDFAAVAILIATVITLVMSRIGPVRMMIAGSVFGVLRSRLFSLPGMKTVLSISLRAGAWQ